MVLDTSALVAVLEREPGYESYLRAITRDRLRLLSAVSYLEALVVMAAKKPETGRNAVDGFVQRFAIEVVPFNKQQAMAAALGYERFGKGRHPAGLNFGDCAALGLAVDRSEALLFKGNDFSRTDVTRVPVD